MKRKLNNFSTTPYPSLQRRGLLFIVFLIPCVFFAQSKFEIELVESIPIETTLDNPDIRNTQEVWLEMINSAKETLDIEQFYISNQKGEPLDTILNAIVAAAKRGVKVRLIVDSEMYKTYSEDVDWLYYQDLNIVRRIIDIKNITGGIQHAKFFIVDENEVFLGSQNFDWRALKHIHELGVRIRRLSVVQYLHQLFEKDWEFAFNPDESIWRREIPSYAYYSLIQKDSNYVIPVNSPNYEFGIIRDIITFSKKEINLQFLSYNTYSYQGDWHELDSLLVRTSNRGVKIKLIISDWNLEQSAVNHFKELIAHPNIEIKYTEIPEWSGGYIPFARVEHCKFVVGDTVCWIGSSNASKSYFYNSRNVGVAFYYKKITERVRDIFYKSWNSNYAHIIEESGTYKSRKHGE